MNLNLPSLRDNPRYRLLRSSVLLFLLAVFVTNGWNGDASGQEIVDLWRVQYRRPAGDWMKPEFDDSDWQQSHGGFGTFGTPGSRVGTVWGTNSIWLRKRFDLKRIPARPALLMHHDEDAEVYINGRLVTSLKGFATKYAVVPIKPADAVALRLGENTMAVHCRQTFGGQFIDVHLIDSEQVPKLPAPKRSTKPFSSELITRWGEQVTPDNTWMEYPRPQMRREDWTNLNGTWRYAITGLHQVAIPKQWTGEILVPYCLESKLGGVERLLDASEALWYQRTFVLDSENKPIPANGLRQVLHFEAVDYRCQVFVNGSPVGTHQGGHTPFSIDITNAVREGDNTLVVRVEDETEGWQLRGKQTLNARGIWYTQVSGIWQTVWLEQVPSRYLRDLKIDTDAEHATVSVRPIIAGTDDPVDDLTGWTTQVLVKDGERTVAEASHLVSDGTIRVAIPEVKLWSPSSPFLYDLVIMLRDETGSVVDRVNSYTGIRSVGKVRDAEGNWRFTLNGQTLFHWGPLDQGWWPDGLLTPPSDAAMKWDIQWLKDAGFNMIRKHIKVEPRRYYYHCDRLGMMVWQDHVSGGQQPKWTRLQREPGDATWPEKQHSQFMLELERMISALENHPSIVCWVPFNEAWGQHRTMAVGRWVTERDPTRLINIASGGNFWPVGDVVDAHQYPHPAFPFDQGADGRFDDYIKVMGEFGGHGLPVIGHIWDANRRNWGYGGLPKNKEEYKDRYIMSLNMLDDLRRRGIAAGVYTQTTDVEGEINGLMTYDRKVIKIDARELADLHKVLFQEPDRQ